VTIEDLVESGAVIRRVNLDGGTDLLVVRRRLTPEEQRAWDRHRELVIVRGGAHHVSAPKRSPVA
jgi:hypothetical protein